MVEEVMRLLEPAAGQVVLDCTLGRCGHAQAIMPRLAPGGRYVGLDLDPANVEHARQLAAESPVKLEAVHSNFAAARNALDSLGIDKVDGLLADLGFASTQMADANRGMSFQLEGPLDMRLDPTAHLTAAQIVNSWPEREIADLLWEYGEERLSRKIARKTTDVRAKNPIKTTRDLAELCAAAYGPAGRHGRIDPATRTFQALRIAVNDEMGNLEALLSALPDLVKPGGRVAIISFHSLEDRRVKHAFRELAAAGRAEILTKKPLEAGEAEVALNRRSRSAKTRGLRVV
jgi:16S rRNA (cytosine1402-N4)-methyltransferase